MIIKLVYFIKLLKPFIYSVYQVNRDAEMEKRDYGIFILRFGLGIFFLVFGILKFISHGPVVNMVYPMFYGGMAVSTYIYILSGTQILLGIMIIIGWKTCLASIILMLMQLSTVLVTMPKLIVPFKLAEGMPPNFLFFGAVPILGALIALILIGHGKMCLDKK